MTTAVGVTPAADPSPPPDLAIDMETGEIGTRAELEARAPAPERAGVVKPGEETADPGAPAAAKPPAAAPVVEEKPLAERQAEAAARLRARGAARRTRVAEEAQLRGHAQTLEQQLATQTRARQEAERAAARDPLDVLKERGQVGKAFQQAAIDENTPEAIARRAIADTAAVREELAAFRRDAAKAARDAEAASARDQFVRYAVDAKEQGDDGKPSDVAAFPHVAAHVAVDREGVLQAADRLLRVAHGRGYRPTWDQVLQELQTRYEKAATLTAAAPAAATETPVDPPKAKAKGANGARTLTTKTQERALPAKRFEDMEARNTSIDGGTDEQLEYLAELARREARR